MENEKTEEMIEKVETVETVNETGEIEVINEVEELELVEKEQEIVEEADKEIKDNQQEIVEISKEEQNSFEFHIDESPEAEKEILEQREEMRKIMDGINSNNCAEMEKYKHLYYGASWYIATGEENQLDMYMGEKTTEADRKIIREVICKMMEEAEKEIEAEKQAETEIEIETIAMEGIAKCTDNVTGPEKANVMSKLKRLIEIEKILKPEEENMLNAMDIEKRE